MFLGRQCRKGAVRAGSKGHKLVKRQMRFFRIDSIANDLVNSLRWKLDDQIQLVMGNATGNYSRNSEDGILNGDVDV